jgi:hypothetical protein
MPRVGGAADRMQTGMYSQQQLDLFLRLRQNMQIWILVKDAADRDVLLAFVVGCGIPPTVFTLADVSDEVAKSNM